ncbi:hypothetical protein [Leuconostoc miyukkimchii]|uniref:hypothetical protein n=1 Tax=Leuconostoc miyukkimchii TaxID=910540 RepID=UPI001C7D3E06|nr:hypothetical protein [Leuconostoc miyukkimchii]
MKRLEVVLPTFVFVVLLGANLLNAPHLSLLVIVSVVLLSAIPSLVVFGLIKFLTWWMLR